MLQICNTIYFFKKNLILAWDCDFCVYLFNMVIKQIIKKIIEIVEKLKTAYIKIV